MPRKTANEGREVGLRAGSDDLFLALRARLVFHKNDMTLLTAHRILISTAVAFFFGLGLWELRNYFNAATGWAAARGVLYLLVSAGFAVYLKNLKRLYE